MEGEEWELGAYLGLEVRETRHSHNDSKRRAVLLEKARAGGGRVPGEVSHRAPPACRVSPQWPPGGAVVPRRLQSGSSRAGEGRGTIQPAPLPEAGQAGHPRGSLVLNPDVKFSHAFYLKLFDLALRVAESGCCLLHWLPNTHW